MVVALIVKILISTFKGFLAYARNDKKRRFVIQRKFKIYTLGCKVNQYDSADLSRRMIAVGWQLAEKGADSSVGLCC